MTAESFVKKHRPTAEISARYKYLTSRKSAMWEVKVNGKLIGKGDTQVKAWQSAKNQILIEQAQKQHE